MLSYPQTIHRTALTHSQLLTLTRYLVIHSLYTWHRVLQFILSTPL
jgi:hypothetical protein